MEIERKWHVLSPDLRKIEERCPYSSLIRQAYVQTSPFELRIRQKDDKYLMTIKEGSGLARPETEDSITEKLFLALWSRINDHSIEKVRYVYTISSLTVEIDVYSGALSGLVVIEIEFSSKADSIGFDSSLLERDWGSLEDVTQNAHFKNASLARFGMPPS
jgi:adenylate cyclase